MAAALDVADADGAGRRGGTARASAGTGRGRGGAGAGSRQVDLVVGGVVVSIPAAIDGEHQGSIAAGGGGGAGSLETDRPGSVPHEVDDIRAGGTPRVGTTGQWAGGAHQ